MSYWSGASMTSSENCYSATNLSGYVANDITVVFTCSNLVMNCGVIYDISFSCEQDNCENGRKDTYEDGVDCGSQCGNVCATCSDGIQNQGESK
jgi:hypothetical protein